MIADGSCVIIINQFATACAFTNNNFKCVLLNIIVVYSHG